MSRIVISILIMHLSITSFCQTVTYKHGKLWSDGVSLNYESISQLLGNEVLDLYKPARSEYVRGIVLTSVGSAIIACSGLLVIQSYRANPYVFDLMTGKRQFEEEWMNRHAVGGIVIAAGFAASGLIISSFGVFHMIRGSNRIKMSLAPAGISLAMNF